MCTTALHGGRLRRAGPRQLRPCCVLLTAYGSEFSLNHLHRQRFQAGPVYVSVDKTKLGLPSTLPQVLSVVVVSLLLSLSYLFLLLLKREP